MRVSHDYCFWNQVTRVGELSIIPQQLLNYRVHNSKASSFANKNREQYDTLMITLLNDVWESRGLHINNSELRLIYKYLFCAHTIWRVSTLIRFLKLWGKVKNQLKRLRNTEAAAIKKMFIIRLNSSLLILRSIRGISNRAALIRSKNKERMKDV